jgi:pyrroloquinoline quinone (PQQ) biosynthesis protein C
MQDFNLDSALGDTEQSWHQLLRRFEWNRDQAYRPEEFLDMCLQAILGGFYGTRHELAHLWIRGQLSAADLRFMAIQEYWYFRCTVWWNAAKVLHSPWLSDQRELLGPLMDEAGVFGDAHEDLFLRYLTGLEVSHETVTRTGALPQTVACVDEFFNLNTHGALVESLAANNLVAETMRPKQYPLVLKAFREHYTWVPPEALEFFRLHAEADIEHAALGERLFKKYARTVEAQRLAWSALTRSLGARWAFYDGILQYMRDPDPPLMPVWETFPFAPQGG